MYSNITRIPTSAGSRSRWCEGRKRYNLNQLQVNFFWKGSHKLCHTGEKERINGPALFLDYTWMIHCVEITMLTHLANMKTDCIVRHVVG